MRYDLTQQQERDKKRFERWLEREIKKHNISADYTAMMDNYDPETSLTANIDFFVKHYGLSQHTLEEHAEIFFAQTEADLVAQMREVPERTIRNIATALGYTVRRKEPHRSVVWDIYGRKSYYSPEEAEKIVKELTERGFETNVFNTTLQSGEKQCVVKYKRDLMKQPAPVLSIE